MEAIKKKKKLTRADVEQNARNLIVQEVAKGLQAKKEAEDKELKAYVKTLEAMAWVGTSVAVLIGLAWITCELLKL